MKFARAHISILLLNRFVLDPSICNLHEHDARKTIVRVFRERATQHTERTYIHVVCFGQTQKQFMTHIQR